MEMVLDVYRQPYKAEFPVVCMDESPKQLIKETRQPITSSPGSLAKYDYEYERCGVCNIFLQVNHWQLEDLSNFIENIANEYSNAQKITLVMDNLNTHKPGSLYEIFAPEKAKKLWDRFHFIYTPKHGSWLNMAEIELNVLNGQCLNRRIDKLSTVIKECNAWQKQRNNMNAKINWQFTTKDALIKLKRLYPTLHS